MKQKSIDEYYGETAWDESGLPTREKLISLGLQAVAYD
jgi:aldehyde:ferredoxin oxidoreductase